MGLTGVGRVCSLCSVVEGVRFSAGVGERVSVEDETSVEEGVSVEEEPLWRTGYLRDQ